MKGPKEIQLAVSVRIRSFCQIPCITRRGSGGPQEGLWEEFNPVTGSRFSPQVSRLLMASRTRLRLSFFSRGLESSVIRRKRPLRGGLCVVFAGARASALRGHSCDRHVQTPQTSRFPCFSEIRELASRPIGRVTGTWRVKDQAPLLESTSRPSAFSHRRSTGKDRGREEVQFRQRRLSSFCYRRAEV